MRKLGHFQRVIVIWLAVAAISMTLAAIFLTPVLPPGTGGTQASGQRFDNEVLLLVALFVCALIFVYFGYALVVFRARDPRVETDGPAIRGNSRVQVVWLVSTTSIVLFLAAFGTYELLGGAGGGQGSKPVFTAFSVADRGTQKGDPPLQVQVIGQQWQFTYRYVSNGDFESAQLVLPAGQQVELHVTSLDVIHSFWIPTLGVKADANPGFDNIDYITPTKIENVRIQCAELCGLFHGYMFDTGRIVSRSAFAAFVTSQSRFVAPVTKYLPAFHGRYLPEPLDRAG